MELVKARFHNKMDNEFLTEFAVVYIERTTEKFNSDIVIDKYYVNKEYRA